MGIILRSLSESRVIERPPVELSSCWPVWSSSKWRRVLQKIGWWLCRRMTVATPIEKVTYTEIACDSQSLLEKAQFNRHAIRMIWDQEARYIVVGSRSACELWGEAIKNQFLQFTAYAPLYANGERRIMGLQVVVVPWLEDGIFLLPELKDRQHLAMPPDRGSTVSELRAMADRVDARYLGTSEGKH